MVRFHTKANPQGQYYLPKEVREELGTELDLVCNTKAAILYNRSTSLELVLKSVEVLTKDLEHRIEMQQTMTDCDVLKGLDRARKTEQQA